MKRIVVIGVGGSGKTTLAKELARRLNLPYIHSDELAWEANWQQPPKAVFLERIAAATGKEEWVFDGNRLSFRGLIWSRANTIVWLDFSLPVVLRRICIRGFRRVVTREELWNGNKENWRRALGGVRASILLLRRRRIELPRLLAEFPHLQVIHLRSPRQALDWLRQLK
jgi:adenylate kinase family enzyme